MPTPHQSAAASRSASKQSHAKKPVADPNPLGEFAVEVQKAMDAVAADLAAGSLDGWNDARLREQTRGMIIANVQATEQGRALRRQLLTRAQVEEREEKRDTIILDRLQEFVEFAVGLVPLDQQAETRKRSQEFLNDVRGRIADDLDNMQ